MYLIQFIVKMIEFAWMGNHVLQHREPWVQEKIIQHEQGQAGRDRWILFDVCEGRDTMSGLNVSCTISSIETQANQCVAMLNFW